MDARAGRKGPACEHVLKAIGKTDSGAILREHLALLQGLSRLPAALFYPTNFMLFGMLLSFYFIHESRWFPIGRAIGQGIGIPLLHIDSARHNIMDVNNIVPSSNPCRCGA